MKLLSDRILVKKVKSAANVTTSGLILSNKPKNSNDFEVILTGPDCKKIAIGDVVRKYPNVTGIPLSYNGEDCVMLREDGEIEFVTNKN